MKKLIVLLVIILAVSVFGQGGAPVPFRKKPASVVFGKAGDSTDVTTALRTALAEATTSRATLVLDSGVYLITDSIVVNNCEFVGYNAKLSFVLSGQKKAVVMGNNSAIKGFTIEIDSTGSGVTGDGSYGSAVCVGQYDSGTGYSNISISDLTIKHDGRGDADGIFVTGRSSNIRISNIHFTKSSVLGRAFEIHWGNALSADTTADTGHTWHPNNIQISNIAIDSMTRTGTITNGLHLSGVYNISVDNVKIQFAERAFTVIPGDYGYRYAFQPDLDTSLIEGQGIVLNRIFADSLTGMGMFISGSASPKLPGALTADQSSWFMPVHVSNSTFKGDGSADGVAVDNCRDVVIEGCTFDGFSTGIGTGANVIRLKILGCTIVRNQYHGIQLSDGSSGPVDALVRDCYIADNDKIGNNRSQIEVGQATRAVIDNNRLGLSSGEGALSGITMGSLNRSGHSITNNYVYGASNGAYYFWDGDVDSTTIVEWRNNRAAAGMTWFLGSAAGIRAAMKLEAVVDDTTRFAGIIVDATPPADNEIMKYDAASGGWVWSIDDTASASSGDAAEADTAGNGTNIVAMSSPYVLQEGTNVVLTVINGDTVNIALEDTLSTIKYISVDTLAANKSLAVAATGYLRMNLESFNDLTGNGLALDVAKLAADTTVLATKNHAQAYADSVGSIDSFFVAESLATSTGWKQSGDTVFVDTTGGSGGSGTTDSIGFVFGATTKYQVDKALKIALGNGIGFTAPTDSGTSVDTSTISVDTTVVATIGHAQNYADSAVTNHVAVADPHTGYLKESDTNSYTTTTLLSVDSAIGDSLVSYLLSATASSTYETITKVGLIGDDTTNFKTAYGWGDHSAQGYINTLLGLWGFVDHDYFDTTTALATDSLFVKYSDSALGAQRATTDAAGNTISTYYLPLSGGQMTGNITMLGAQTVDGKDVSALTDIGQTVDSTEIVDGSVSLSGDLHLFTENEFTAKMSNASVIFTNNTVGDVTVVGAATIIGANKVDSTNVGDSTLSMKDINWEGGIVSARITDGTILEADINATNAPTDNYVLSYNLGALNFTWVPDATGGGLGGDSVRVLLSDRVDTSTAGLVFNGGNITMSGAETVDGKDVSTLTDIGQTVDSTEVTDGDLSEDDMNWRYEYIPLNIVFGRGPGVTDSVVVQLPRYQSGIVLAHDSTNQGSDVDSFWIGGTVPFDPTASDSIIFTYKGDGTGVIDSLILWGPDRSNATNVADSIWYSVDVALSASVWTRVAYYINEGDIFQAGDNFALKFRTTLATDDDWIQIAWVQMRCRR